VTTTVTSEQPHVVIVGAGFAGLNAAFAFENHPVRVTLVDQWNHHLFQPLLYQVATAMLSPADIASPIRSIVRKQRNVTVLMSEVKGVDVHNRLVKMDGHELHYDYLILATGTQTSYFGHGEWEPLAPGLKSMADALEIRRRVFRAFEAAEMEDDPQKRSALLNFVVVGGGPTGVEMAGALAEIARFTLKRDFRHFDPTATDVYLIDAMPRLLTAFPEKLAQTAQKDLEILGVHVVLDTMVSAIEDGVVVLPDRRLEAGTIVWAAGVTARPLVTGDDIEIVGQSRIVVDRCLNIPAHPEIYVAGDLGATPGKDGKPLPGLAPVAIQEGTTAAENILRRIQGEAQVPFQYRDRGSMATIGRNRAVGVIGPLRLHGLIAWIAWAIIHVFMLIGFRNRMVVMVQWIWAYATRQRSARLIIGGNTDC
jgi:NADH dehydrogenase